MSTLLNLVYLLLLVVLSPVLLYRRLMHGKYRDGWDEKFHGRLPVPTSNPDAPFVPRVWFHAVSVGEVLQLETVVAELLRRRPECEIVITTTTTTGLAVATEKFPRHHVCYFPLDFSWAVKAALRRIEPDVVALVELELWPNFIREVCNRAIPLLLINGRISEKSYRGYHRLHFLMREVLRCFDHFAVQSEIDAERLRRLGAPAERITVTGSVKFDRVDCERDNPRTEELRRSFGIASGEAVFVAGSTHAPEEEIALQAWMSLRDEFPALRLLLVPRHQERFEEVARLIESHGLPLLRRSTAGRHSKALLRERPVLLLDTLGELSACWGLADVAFVGGSLTQRGGQNMMEPAGYAAAVLFGPNTRNFRDVTEMLLAGNASRVVRNQSELAAVVRRLLCEPALRLELGRNAQRLVLSQRGATVRTVGLIEHNLPAGRLAQPPQWERPQRAA